MDVYSQELTIVLHAAGARVGCRNVCTETWDLGACGGVDWDGPTWSEKVGGFYCSYIEYLFLRHLNRLADEVFCKVGHRW